MKKLYAILLFLGLGVTATAQDPSAYFMEGATFRSEWNPAFAPLRGYVNIPILGGIQLHTRGNLSLDKVFFPVNGKLQFLLNNDVPASLALADLSADNTFALTNRINIIGFGAFTHNHRNFWSFDINLRTDAEVHVPYELLSFLKTGDDTQIRNIQAAADSYLEAAFAYSFPIGSYIYLGIRGKFLAGVARSRVNLDRFDATLGEDSWTANAHGSLEMTGLSADQKIDDQGDHSYDLGAFNFDKYSPSGYGFAFDIGATYNLLPNLQFSASINDLGVLFWDKKRSQFGTLDEAIEFKGVEITDEEVTNPRLDLDDLEFQVGEATGKKQMLHTSFNVGVEYDVWRHKIGFGVLYHGRMYEYETRHNLTASVNFHPARWVCLTGSYSFCNNQSHAVGLAVNLCPSWINFYIATNVLTGKKTPQWLPIKQSQMSVTLGLGIPIGKRSHRIVAYINRRDKR